MQQLQLSKHKLALANIHSREPCSAHVTSCARGFLSLCFEWVSCIKTKGIVNIANSSLQFNSRASGMSLQKNFPCFRGYEAFLVPSMPLSAITHKQLYYPHCIIESCLHWVSPVTLDTAIPCWWCGCSSQCAPQWPYVKTFFYSQAPNRKMPFSPLIYSSVLNWRDETIGNPQSFFKLWIGKGLVIAWWCEK